MKFSENWLRELVDIPVDRAQLVQKLTMAGLEVEGVSVVGDRLEGIVVAEILEARAHPDADRLQVCTVDAGEADTLTIVCGAPNARVGLKAPLARIGATLPDGTQIKAAKLRGVESRGMLCSARELGLSTESTGLMELPQAARTGAPLVVALGLPDASIELKLTPNRPDCLGMLGLAHDVAALFDSDVHWLAEPSPEATSERTRGVQLAAGGDCPRYLGRVIEDLDPAAATPGWMAERLRRAGLRPINAVVDVSNYVMLELGQPLHAFDDDRLEGDIVVRHAREGEALTLLDGAETTLAGDFLVIADQARALAVAGVVGGRDSSVTDQTRNIFLESAHFAPAAIVGRARRLGLHTDASHRFERGVDPDLPLRALDRAAALLNEIAGGRPGPLCSAERREDLPVRSAVTLRRERLARVLGMSVADAEVTRILTALGMQVDVDASAWTVVPPSRRFDIEREEDLIEEVARVHGYQHIPVRAPSGQLALRPQSETRIGEPELRAQMAARDYQEAVCYAFIGREALQPWGLQDAGVPLANPLSADLAIMRPSLLPGLVAALAHNRARQQARVRLFELGHVFLADAEAEQGSAQAPAAPREPARLAAVICGPSAPEQWGRQARSADVFDIKGDLQSLLALSTPTASSTSSWRFAADDLPAWLHPGRAARVLRDGREAGVVGTLHPRLANALDLGEDVQVFEVDLESVRERAIPSARAVSRFPSVRRDIAVELPLAVTWAEVEASVREAVGSLLAQLVLFDEYTGSKLDAGRKSFAMGLILLDGSRTLTDVDADRCVQRAVEALQSDCKARLRN